MLADNGLLFIGHAEAGIFSGNRFTPAPYPKAFAFHKKARDSQSAPLPLAFTPGEPQTSSREILDDEFSGAGHLQSQDKFEQAIRACEDQIQKFGPSAEAFYQLASIFEKKKDWQNAIKMLKKATYLDPNYIDAIDMLAAIYQRLGDENNYQACLNRGRRIITRLNKP